MRRLFLLMTLCLLPQARTQSLRPDMRLWTVTKGHPTVVVTQTEDEIRWTNCSCSGVPMICEVDWQASESGVYLMSIRGINYDSSGFETWRFGIVGGFTRSWNEWSGNDTYKEIPQIAGFVTKNVKNRLFVHASASTFRGRSLTVTLTKAEPPLMWPRGWGNYRTTWIDVNTIPRWQGTSAWLFFVSPQRRDSNLPIAGIEGSGLWLLTPFFVGTTTTPTASLQLAPVPHPRLLPLFWQVLEVTDTGQGVRMALGSRNQVLDY